MGRLSWEPKWLFLEAITKACLYVRFDHPSRMSYRVHRSSNNAQQDTCFSSLLKIQSPLSADNEARVLSCGSKLDLLLSCCVS
jgi:hypothetical protein